MDSGLALQNPTAGSNHAYQDPYDRAALHAEVLRDSGSAARGQKCRCWRAALALLLVHGHWAACALHVRVCAPEECGEALPLIRRAATGLTCGPP